MNREALLLGILSLIVAVLLWLQVETQTEPSKQREIPISLELRNLAPDLIATRYPTTVTVIAEGSAEQLDQINAKQLTAFIDLARAKAGIHPYPVQINAPTRMPTSLSLRNPRETVDISAVTRKSWPVTIDERGRPPQDLQYDGAQSQPSTITVVGPESAVSEVEKVRAMIDLSKLKPGDPIEAIVEILGKNNQPVPWARSDPRTIMVFPAIASAPAVNRVLVTPIWKGQPAFGFQVSGYEIRPSQVQLTGRPGVVSKIAKVDTNPIDIEGLRQNSTLRAKLKIPFGIKANVTEVRIDVKLAPAVLPSPASPAGGVGNQ